MLASVVWGRHEQGHLCKGPMHTSLDMFHLQHTVQILRQFQPPNANLLCADVIANLGKAIVGQISNFDPRSLTDALWGFAKLGGKLDGGTISKLAQRVKELASKFKPQEAANALWALVKLDQQNGGNAMKVISC